MQIETGHLVRLGAAAAMAGGALRIVSSFIPYVPESPALETLYAATDICLMFGLVAIYLSVHARAGLAGLAGFVIALTGIASIVGPDPEVFGIDFYFAGAMIVLMGLLVLSAGLLNARRLRVPAALWIASFMLALASALAGQAAVAMSGIAFGAAFLLAGFALSSFSAGPARAPQ